MKKIMSIVLLLLVPVITSAQIKGKKSKSPYTGSNEKVYKVGDSFKLGLPSNGETFAYAYVYKKSLSLKSIANAAKSIRDVKNMNVKNVKNLSNNINTVKNLADNDLVNSAATKMMGKVVSEKYVEENALASSFSNTKWKIKSFKVFKDDESGEEIVHAIAKGNGKTIAVCMNYAIGVKEI